MNTLPPVAPSVLADVLDDLPPRLRKRVDAALSRAADWPVTVDGDHATAPVDDDTTLTWTLTAGVLASADALVCSCLLAPRCLHRGVAVAAAETRESTAEPPPVATVPTEVTAPAEVAGITEAERTAATALWNAGATVLRAGASGSGTVVRAELLRAVHQARIAGLHRAAATGLRVATALAAARTGADSFDRAELTSDLLDLLLVCHDLRTGEHAPPTLRGTARREYRPIGSLRLYGLCTEPVVAATGHSGVVTHLTDTDGLLWTIPAIMPGGPERVPTAANGPVAVGESGLTHRALSRAGLVLSGGTASPDHRLGAGRKVRAAKAQGAAWTEEPVSRLWEQPLPEQVARAFAANAMPESDRPAGADLLFLDAQVVGKAGPALRVRTDTTELDLTGDNDRTRTNLRILAASTGTRLRVIARLLPHLPGTATALAVQGDALTLPATLSGHIDLSFDQLQSSHVPTGETRDLPARPTPEHQIPPPLHPLRNLVHRIALAGRSVATATSSNRNVATLTENGLTTTAAVLTTLTASTHTRHRDTFGRTVDDHTDDFPRAWLTAALHLREFTTAATQQTWLPS